MPGFLRIASSKSGSVLYGESLRTTIAILKADLEALTVTGKLYADRLIRETSDDRRALVDEQGMIARLDEARPLVIDCADNPRAARFTQAFPQAGNFLATHFRTVASFGEYRVLAWTAG